MPSGTAQHALPIAVYVAMVLLPLSGWALVRLRTLEVSALGLGRAAALLGFGLLAMQLVLAARLHWAERPFGLDRIYQFHKAMGGLALLLLLTHPLLLGAGGYGGDLLTSLRAPWAIWAGKLALLTLAGMVPAAALRRRLRIEFGRWRMAHGVVAIVLLAGGVVHALCVTDDLHDLPAGLAFLAAAAVGLVAWATYRASPAVSGRGAHWTVESVRRETRNVRTLTLRPPADERRMTFLPGQFCFLRPVGPGLPHEDHPFTVASAPSAEGCVSFTIKASGDFTQAIQSVKVGRPMSLSAPYGRFSYLLQPDETDLVFIAGGIGITPLMGMIRHMQSTGADREVLLLYGSRTEEDIAFREELADLGAGHVPRLRVVHVLSRPSSGWGGEVGRIDREKVARLCGAVEGKGFYVCGPREMMRDVTRALRSLGAPRSRIHYEQFEL